MKKFSVQLLGGLFCIYLMVCGYFYFVQTELIFRPVKLPPNTSYSYPFHFEERIFETPSGASIHAIHAFQSDSSNKLVLFFHGNASTNKTSALKFQLFLDEGFDVLYPDYRGFGLSSGDLNNEKDLIEDMQFVYSEMLHEYEEDSVFVVGYSLGTGIAAQVAAKENPRGLMLWTPYTSILDMKNQNYPFLPDFLVRYPLRTDIALSQIEEPITIFFAEHDRVLPIERSLSLKKYLKPGDRSYILEGQGHLGVYRNQRVKELLPDILNK